MLKAVLARAPLPASPAVYAASAYPLAKKKAADTAASAVFVAKGKISELPSGAPLGFTGAAGQVELTLSGGGDACARAMVAGLGATPTIRDYRLAVTGAVRKAKKLRSSSVTLHPPAVDEVSTAADLLHPARPLPEVEMVEKTAAFAVTGVYEYDRLKTKKNDATAAAVDGEVKKAKAGKKPDSNRTSTTTPMDIIIASTHTQAIATGTVIGTCVNDCRNLGNLREDEGVPAFYVEWAQRFLVPEGVKVVKILKGEQLRKQGLNLLHSVGKGSAHEPYVMVLEYVGNKTSSQSTCLVGKGVTFDCGGLNVKPYGSMETMHTDMMGAATVLTTMKAVASLKLPVNVVGAVGLVENAIGPDCFFPSSILTSLKGLTVEILNTDAEGRLVLADVLTYVQTQAKLAKTPSTIIDLATLTGAIVVGLGDRRAGVFSNSARLSEKLMATGTQSGDELWPMPVGQEHLEAVKGGMADLINATPGRSAGSSTAAAFLSNFVEPGMEWAHLDIAGVADVGDKPKGFNPAGVTGFGVQLLVDYLRRK